ncbi:sulfotransferase domain-containing protein [Streptomyces rimosus]|uniref:sulfotransferase domain-containing protein n=1 Tax=Streptomyces rimosus TaxID=1927 RepID=UPI0037D5C270
MSEKIYYLLHGIQDRYSALYQENISRMGERDILIASIGGSGQSFLGNILLELGLNYADAYTEELHTDGTCSPAPAYADYRSHLAATTQRDGSAFTDTARWPRFVKTHLTPGFFAHRPLQGVWILIRDPRDALYSWYNFRIHFAKDPLDIRAGSFEEWLDQPGPNGVSRLEDWADFYEQWAEARTGFSVTTVSTFEELKRAPEQALRAALGDLDVTVTDSDLQQAIERSSFSVMRAHEESHSSDRGKGAVSATRLMRSGTPDEWQGWITPSLQEKFAGPSVTATAQRYGYRMLPANAVRAEGRARRT